MASKAPSGEIANAMRDHILNWLQSKSFIEIDFRCRDNPENDPQDDYLVRLFSKIRLEICLQRIIFALKETIKATGALTCRR